MQMCERKMKVAFRLMVAARGNPMPTLDRQESLKLWTCTTDHNLEAKMLYAFFLFFLYYFVILYLYQ